MKQKREWKMKGKAVMNEEQLRIKQK
jgi:hypothetical protein